MGQKKSVYRASCGLRLVSWSHHMKNWSFGTFNNSQPRGPAADTHLSRSLAGHRGFSSLGTSSIHTPVTTSPADPCPANHVMLIKTKNISPAATNVGSHSLASITVNV